MLFCVSCNTCICTNVRPCSSCCSSHPWHVYCMFINVIVECVCLWCHIFFKAKNIKRMAPKGKSAKAKAPAGRTLCMSACLSAPSFHVFALWYVCVFVSVWWLIVCVGCILYVCMCVNACVCIDAIVCVHDVQYAPYNANWVRFIQL